MKFQDIVLSGLGRRYYTSASKLLFLGAGAGGSQADRKLDKLDIFFIPADAALPNGEHDWLNVLIILLGNTNRILMRIVR
jgi:hypothetical protein